MRKKRTSRHGGLPQRGRVVLRVNDASGDVWILADRKVEGGPHLADEVAELGDEALGIEGLAAVQAIQPAAR